MNKCNSAQINSQHCLRFKPVISLSVERANGSKVLAVLFNAYANTVRIAQTL